MIFGLFPAQADRRRAALIVARLQGCTCEPDLEAGSSDAAGIEVVRVLHDESCPLIVARDRRN